VPKKFKIAKNESWFNELTCLAIGVFSVGAMIAVLAIFNDSSLPNWPFSITLNTLIAFIAAINNATLAVPLSSDFSQLKWIWFKRKPAPLSNMELSDEASRGSWGAAQLLYKVRG
jgi:hypothetical protein